MDQIHIHLRTGVKNNFRSLLQWNRNEIRARRDKAMTVFTITQITATLIRDHIHKAWVIKSPYKAKTLKTKQFQKKLSEWTESNIFEDFLFNKPGINGVQLKHSIRDSHNPIIQVNVEF